MKSQVARAALFFGLGALLGGAGVWSGFPSARSVVVAGTAAPHEAAAAREDSDPSAPWAEELQSTALAQRAAAESSEVIQEAARTETLSKLEAEFLELHRDGTIEDAVLLRHVLPSLAARGRTDEVIALLEQCPKGSRGYLYYAIVGPLPKANLADLRRFWIERALAEGVWSTNDLVSVDPLRALSEMDAQVERNGGVVPADLRPAYLRMLTDHGRVDDARRLAEEMLAADPRDRKALTALGRVDFEAAASRYRALIAQRDQQDEWQRKLYELCIVSDHPYDAEPVLRAMADGGTRLEAEDWGDLAESFLEAGDEARAIANWSQALRMESEDPYRWSEEMSEHAPTQLLALLEERVQGPVNDQFWAALGDARWRAGQRDAAREAWQEAVRRDPTNGDWSDKLELAASGGDPLDY